MTEPTLHLWTDGACKGNPGPGGWGVYLKSEGFEKELSPFALPETDPTRFLLRWMPTGSINHPSYAR